MRSRTSQPLSHRKVRKKTRNVISKKAVTLSLRNKKRKRLWKVNPGCYPSMCLACFGRWFSFFLFLALRRIMHYGWRSLYHRAYPYAGAKRSFELHVFKDQFGTPCSVSNSSICVLDQRHSVSQRQRLQTYTKTVGTTGTTRWW